MRNNKMFAIGMAAAAGLSVSSPALACAPPLCEPTVRLFGPAGIEVATNFVYFKLLVDDPGPLLLRTRAGQPIAASIRQLGDDRVFAPDEPLAEGTDAELVYTPRCKPIGQEPQEPQPVVYAFHAGIAGEYEPRPGALELTEQGLRYPRQANEASFVAVRYYTPEVTGGAFHLMEHFATIDGLPIALGGIEAGNLGLRIKSMCAPPNDKVARDTCGAITSVPPGDHTIEVWTHVIGQTGASERARMTIDTRCSARCPESAAPPSSAEQAGAAVQPSAADSGAPEQEDAGAGRPSEQEAAARAPASCSVTQLAKRSTGSWFALACCGWLATATWRRRRHSRVAQPSSQHL